MANPFKQDNPFKPHTVKEQIARLTKELELMEKERLKELDAAVSVDPENKHGQW